MDLKDIYLRGKDWNSLLDKVVDELKIFKTYYQVFILSASIGIMYDKKEEYEKSSVEDNDTFKTIVRTVLLRNISDLEFLFSTAIVSTKTIDLSLDERLRLAFGEADEGFDKIRFLLEFANYGMRKIKAVVTDNDLETMQSINDLFEELEQYDYLSEVQIDTNMLYSSF